MITSNHENYKKTISVRCPALDNELVFFSAAGYNHLIYKGRKKRPQKEVDIRLKLLPLAIKLVSKASIFQEYEETDRMEPIRIKSERLFVKKKVRYWGIIAIIDSYKIKVIIKQVGKGKKHFWSVIPNWVTNKARDGTKVRKMFKGNLEED